MSTYAIGDIQGCFSKFIKLLDKINFDQNKDQLWLVGDIINRGPESELMLDWIYKNQSNIKIVLGNHDLHFLAVYYNVRDMQKSDTLEKTLAHKDCDKWVTWLRKQPLIYHDNKLNFLMVHAGIPPQFDLNNALELADNLSKKLSSNEKSVINFLENIFGNNPNNWETSQKNSTDQDRYLINAFTRMRHCNEIGDLDLDYKGSKITQDNNFKAWFLWNNRKTKDIQIIFGHWAALVANDEIKVMPNPVNPTNNIFALDTGCAWGNQLTALRLEDKKIFFI